MKIFSWCLIPLLVLTLIVLSVACNNHKAPLGVNHKERSTPKAPLEKAVKYKSLEYFESLLED